MFYLFLTTFLIKIAKNVWLYFEFSITLKDEYNGKGRITTEFVCDNMEWVNFFNATTYILTGFVPIVIIYKIHYNNF